jgi:hypothetical protein
MDVCANNYRAWPRAAPLPPQFTSLKCRLRAALVGTRIKSPSPIAADRHSVAQLDLAGDLQRLLYSTTAVLGAQFGKIARQVAGEPLSDCHD